MYSYFNKNLFLIDFEYSAPNPFVTDIANIANECVFDYMNKYPYFNYYKNAYPTDNELKEMIRAL